MNRFLESKRYASLREELDDEANLAEPCERTHEQPMGCQDKVTCGQAGTCVFQCLTNVLTTRALLDRRK